MQTLSLTETPSDRLRRVLKNLPTRDQDFARSLLSNPRKTMKQWEWINTLLERAENPAPVAPPENAPRVASTPLPNVGDVAGIIKLFDTAKENGGKFPAILMQTASGVTLRLTVAGPTAKMPGTVNVATPGGFANNTFFGRITREGEFVASREEAPADLLDTLRHLAQKPEEAATNFGRTTGKCCFCGIKLTDQRSVTVGYGPDCSEKFGLPWG